MLSNIIQIQDVIESMLSYIDYCLIISTDSFYNPIFMFFFPMIPRILLPISQIAYQLVIYNN